MIKALSFVLLFLMITSDAFAQRHVGPGQQFPDLPAAARARAILPGDTVYIHAGTYRNSTQYIDSLIGRPDAWITIRPFENDSVSINEQYTFSRAQYVRVQGLNFYGNDATQTTRVYHQLHFDYQYDCFNAIHDIIIENCKFLDLNNTGKQGSGAMLKFTGVDRFLVENCIFRNGINMADGISMNGNRNGVIRKCTFEDLSLFGSHCKGGSKNILYERNMFIDCADAGIEVGGDTGPEFFCPMAAPWEADSIAVYANIFIGGKTGVRLAGCTNSEIYNNTFFKQKQFAFRSLNASSRAQLDNNRIANNIFSTDAAFGLYLNASASFDYSTHYFTNNLFHDYRNPKPAQINWSEMPGVQVVGTIIADPMFADTAKRDFSLRKGSPAVGAGVLLAEPVTDHDDKPYVIPRSIGASEGGIQLKVGAQHKSTQLRISPNPVLDVLAIDLGDEQIKTLEVYSVAGMRMLSVPRSTSIRVADVAAGNYVLVARDAAGEVIATVSFIKL